MTGQQLYDKLSVRDHSGSEADEYAQLLILLENHALINGEIDEFYSLLEKAEKEGKKLSFPDPPEELLIEDYMIEDVILI